MDGGGLGLLKFLFPQIPSLASTTLWHALGQSPNSDKWDLRTTLTVQILRSLMGSGGRKPSPIGKVQASTLRDPGVKGKTWVARATIPAPAESEEGVRNAVFKAVDDMAVSEAHYTKPALVDTEVEWTGYRPDAAKEEGLPDISEQEKYDRLMAEPTRTSDTTILYLHGGAYYLCDPATHRALTSRLAKESGGRVCSVRYRLAPQAAFPSQLLDALMVYLSLLYPPPGSLHTAVPADKIVLAGDSAGGNLVFALLQFLLHLHRASPSATPTLSFRGTDVAVPLPAAATANSGWFDIARACPSLSTNAGYDYLPPPTHDDTLSHFPADSVWPTDPPRGDLFCDLSLLDHPLVSPLLAEDWSGAPPLWLETGQEMLSDEDKFVTARAVEQGVKVQYEEYEAMPHCFAMLLPALPTADRCVESWAAFCKLAAEEPGKIQTSGVFVHAKGGVEEKVDVRERNALEMEQVQGLVQEIKARREKGWEREGKGMPKPAL